MDNVKKAVAFEHFKKFTARLGQLEGYIEAKRNIVLRAKAFYFWINKFHTRKD